MSTTFRLAELTGVAPGRYRLDTAAGSTSPAADLSLTEPLLLLRQGQPPAPVKSSTGRPVLYAKRLGLGDRVLATVMLAADSQAPAGAPGGTGGATMQALADLDAAKAPLASPAFTGTPTAPTAAAGTNTTQVATTAFTRGEVAALVASAPGTLDTLGEIAAALASDESAATALATTVAGKAPLASPVFTGNPTAPTPTAGDNDTSIATTAFVKTAVGSSVARRSLALYADFTALTDGTTVAGTTPTVGPALSTSGASTPAISGGKLNSPGANQAGYTYVKLAATPEAVFSESVFTGNATSGTNALAMSSDSTLTLNNLLHLNYGPSGFTLSIRQDGGAFDNLFNPTGIVNWRKPIPADGTTICRVGMSVRGSVVTIHGPNGEKFSRKDPRVALVAGPLIFTEPTTLSGPAAACFQLTWGAVAAATTGKYDLYPSFTDGSNFHDTGQYGQIAGSRNTPWEVSEGYDSTTGYPGVTFGAGTIYTELASALTVGATSIVTNLPLPSGSTVLIESGTGSETVTTSGNPSSMLPTSAPFTSTIGATTKAHAAGVAVTATVPSSGRAIMYWLQTSGLFVLPSSSVLPGNTYLTTSGDTSFTRLASGVIGLKNTYALTVAAQTLAANGAVTFSISNGGFQVITLQANATSSTLAAGQNGQVITLEWVQDATGGRTYAWPTSCVFAGGAAPADTTASKRTSVTFRYDTTAAKWIETARAVAVG